MSQALNLRNLERLGIMNFQNDGFLVEIWDLTPLLYPDVWEKYIKDNGETLVLENHKIVRTKQQILDLLRTKITFDYIIDIINSHHFYYLLIKLKLLRSGSCFLNLSLGSLPLPEVNSLDLVYTRIKKYLFSPLAAMRVLGNATLKKLFNIFIKKYDSQMLIAVSGEKSHEAAQYLGYSVDQIIKVHNLDYDLFLKYRNLPINEVMPYAVFLDEDYAFHSDYLYMGIPAPVTPENYFPAICRGMAVLSREYRVAIKVAAHPRSNYKGLENKYFGDIPVLEGVTTELIRNCNFVICHSSTSIQLAILFGKPLVYVTTNEIESTHFGKAIECFAGVLNKRPINLDNKLSAVNWDNELKIDQSAYAAFIKDYVKMPGTVEIPCWEIISSELKQRLN